MTLPCGVALVNDKSVQAINVIDLPSQLLVGLMVFVLVQLHVFCINLDLLVKIERVLSLLPVQENLLICIMRIRGTNKYTKSTKEEF